MLVVLHCRGDSISCRGDNGLADGGELPRHFGLTLNDEVIPRLILVLHDQGGSAGINLAHEVRGAFREVS